MEQVDKFSNEVVAVREFTYLSDRLCAGGGCGYSVTARTTLDGLRSWDVVCIE